MIKLLKDSLFWGVLLWLIGYLLGILFFPFVPTSIIGWVIMPVGIIITLWVLLKKIQLNSFQEYIVLALVWGVIAVLCDYFFLVKVFKPADGYYKLDVYIYYLLTVMLPIVIGWKRKYMKV